MGAYLSEPITEKNSCDEENELLACGSSSMQGWRINQEDAHNCLLNFDKDTSFFAVYDGHGGPEIALYCSQKLPEFLLTSEAYKSGEMEKALKDAFLGFDETLLKPEVIEELKLLAGDKYPEHGEETETDEEEDLAELCQESRMPLTEVLEKYKEAKVEAGGVAKLKEKEHKPLSPFLRAQRSDGAASSSSSGAGSSSQATESTASGSGGSGWRPPRKLESEIDSTVSSSSTSEKTAEAPREIVSNEASECESATNGAKESYNSPDSSSSSSTVRKSVEVQDTEKPGSSTDQVARPPEVKIANGAADDDGVSASSSKGGGHQEPEISTNSGKSEGVSSSSSAVQENGEVSSNSGGCSSSNDRLPKRSSAPSHIPVDANASSSDSEDEKDETYNENTSSTEDVGDEDSDVEEEEYNSDSFEGSDEEECVHDEDDDVDDAFMSNMIEEPGKDSGCTAVVALLVGTDLYVANAGDSRCVVCRNGEAIEMSYDHKPEDELEHDRITNAGGKVTIDGRVNGGLNLSRAIGDHAYKMNFELPPDKQMITALPDVKRITIMPEDEFMVLACDGIWNFMSSEAVVEFVKKRLDEGRERISQICEELFDNCLARNTLGDGTGCDNMTAIIVKFPRGGVRETAAKASVETSEVVASSKKRSASTDAKEAEEGAKRLKTDDEFPAAVVVDTNVDDVSST
ncbi:probable protein phosphatase CG10417 [Phlebotomus argentipes]|uniref:probable protein phosphatase CG10417 n=1 Tax=Phlebotomus argentipes TaxID=94469 RepID=UPI002892995C|nr:probable protein phosphatase CG10417 [Phlebotomus argentipes]